MLTYALKRVVRSYKLFLALTIGILVATTFFASTNVAADILARESLNKSLEGVVYDFTSKSEMSNWTADTFDNVEAQLDSVSGVSEYTQTTKINYRWNSSTDFDIYGIDWNSDLSVGIQVASGHSSLGVNETYVVVGSINESIFQIDDVIVVSIPVSVSHNESYPVVISWNYTVVGFIEIPDITRSAIRQEQRAQILEWDDDGWVEPYNMLVTDWDLSISPIITKTESIVNKTGTSLQNSHHFKIDRYSFLDPYDIQGSIDNVKAFKTMIESRLEQFDVTVTSFLDIPLQGRLWDSQDLNLGVIALSLPIFFMAYFTGTMVSEVGFNQRRREIGLLLTKGTDRKTVRNMFLIEGVIVGGIAGTASVFLGSAVSWVVLQMEGLEFISVLSNNMTSLVISIGLGMTLALLSVWRPANRASKLEILDALKQYVLIEETAQYKRLLPIVAFALGTYKLIVWILGVNVGALLNNAMSGNLFLMIFSTAWVAIDGVLNFIGPLLFLYGTTKIFIKSSHKFQEVIVRAGSRLFGAFGKLATRNIKRNPSRNAAMVFLLSLIVSYGVFAVGNLFTEYDYVERTALFDVGSDVRLQLSDNVNITETLSNITAHEDVSSATIEYRLQLYSGWSSIETRGINPNEWKQSAFWEPNWFIGDVNQMMNELGDNGIILSISIARMLGLKVGESIFVNNGSEIEPVELKVVGFIGFQSLLDSIPIGPGIPPIDDDPGVPTDIDPGFEPLQIWPGFEGQYPSFVSTTFLNEASYLNSSKANILIKTNTDVNGTALQETFHERFSNIDSSYSFTSEMVDYWNSISKSALTKIQAVAIGFAVVLAVVGTGLVIILTLQEKETEIALLTVRGISKWQLAKTLSAEMLVMVVFSLILGSLVGLVQIFGNVSQMNQGATGIIRYTVALGGISGLIMLSIIGIVLAEAALPLLIVSIRPEAKVDVLRG